MRRFLALALLVLPGIAGCGGSSSETPWPMRPITKDLVPRGEELRGAKASDVARPLETDSDGYDYEADAGVRTQSEDPELD